MGGIKILFFLILLIPFLFSQAQAWDCFTHAYIAKKAGLRIPEAACMPDIVRDEQYDLFEALHYHDAAPDTVVTPEYIDRFRILDKTVSIDGRNYRLRVPHPGGVLYYKIVELYEKMSSLDKSIPDNALAYEYYLFSIAHYIGDLSQPLHNFPYGDKKASDGKVYTEEGKFNKENHLKFDEAFTQLLKKSPDIDKKISSSIKELEINSKEELKKEISKIANSAIKIANQCFREKRLPNEQELINQVSWSISLLKAISKSTKWEIPRGDTPRN